MPLDPDHCAGRIPAAQQAALELSARAVGGTGSCQHLEAGNAGHHVHKVLWGVQQHIKVWRLHQPIILCSGRNCTADSAVLLHRQQGILMVPLLAKTARTRIGLCLRKTNSRAWHSQEGSKKGVKLVMSDSSGLHCGLQDQCRASSRLPLLMPRCRLSTDIRVGLRPARPPAVASECPAESHPPQRTCLCTAALLSFEEVASQVRTHVRLPAESSRGCLVCETRLDCLCTMSLEPIIHAGAAWRWARSSCAGARKAQSTMRTCTNAHQ